MNEEPHPLFPSGQEHKIPVRQGVDNVNICMRGEPTQSLRAKAGNQTAQVDFHSQMMVDISMV